MFLSPLSFVVVTGIETNKGKLLSLLLLGLQLVSYHVFFGPESVLDRKKGLLSGNFGLYFWTKIIVVFNLFLNWNHQVIQIGICFGLECIFQTRIIISVCF